MTSASTSTLPFDTDSPLFVAKAVSITAILGAISGASIGVYRNQNPPHLSVNMATNSGLAGLAFFGIREYIVSPFLLQTQMTSHHSKRLSHLTAKQLGKLPQEEGFTIEEIRYNRILDSAISGALAGGVLSWGIRGRKTALRAAITSSLITSLFQFGVNQTRLLRLNILSQSDSTPQSPLPTSPSTSQFEEATNKVPQTTSENILTSLENSSKPSGTIEEDVQQTLQGRIMGVMSSILPVRRLSDEEYLEVLDKKKRDVEVRLGEIEVEERKLFGGV